MSKRKTIEVERLRNMVNFANEHSDISAERRVGHNTILEIVLHETGNYKGFRYAAGYGPFDGPAEDGVPNPDYDDTRRIYY